MISCAVCGAEASPGQRFCGQCGASLTRTCTACGTENPPDHRFCGSCGTPLISGDPHSGANGPGTNPSPVAERRLVSVLFADLVGFTSLSERRDPEEVRELLSRYFDRCRTLIERYGGTVEKFIGDAVMAVWGSPVAREDDAERAVRAALALTQAVTALGEEVGMPTLRARAGVLTGSAAVELGAESEGMVLGDTVNTASRLQSLAEPGSVLVDDVTRRASEAAIAYEDAGSHQVKGREQAVRAWTALRVVAGAGGARRTAGLEAPFVGRHRELQTIIEAGDRSAAEGRALHVPVLGEAGAGKSRLLWEFFKYLDGIEEARYWHQGRCLSYGEGVGYWALAEMVRARAGILEEEDEPATAREKLRATVENFVSEERERRLVEPRLAHLLRLEERPEADRADLFSGWRLFFERLSDDAPVILAFEDLQWADSGLLDFIDYLLEWSADFPIFVLTFARPELRERRPSWQSLMLAQLAPDAIAAMLEGLAPGLPSELVAQIGRRAEGIPLYAVETVRMLRDRGVLVQEGARYAVRGEITDLDVPETLQALVASRLDGLSAGERALLQDASVLGQSFTPAGVAALSGRPEGEVSEVLENLVAKQVLARDDDPRSSERGQFVFLQALVRTVAYGTLSRRARKARHVAAARHLEQTWPGEARDIAEVLASHYLEAIDADPEAEDVAALRSAARETLTAAGRAAGSLALGPEADRYLQQAAALAEDDLERASLFEQAGRALWRSGDAAVAEERLRQAVSLYQRNNRSAGGSAAIRLAEVLVPAGRLDEARELLEPFHRGEDPGIDQITRASALAELSRVMLLAGDLEQGNPLLEEALTTLELQEAWAPLATALINRAIYLFLRRRREEAAGILARALSIAERQGLMEVALRARYNLAATALDQDRLVEAVATVNDGLALARERGDRIWESQLNSQQVAPLYVLGRWDEVVPLAESLKRSGTSLDAVSAAAFLAPIAAARGDRETLEDCVSLAAPLREASYIDLRVCVALTLGREALERGAPHEAVDPAREVLHEPNTAGECIQEAYAQCIEAAVQLCDEALMNELIEHVDKLPPALATPLLRAGRARLLADLAHRRGDDAEARRCEEEAVGLLRSLGARPLLARTLAERAARREDQSAVQEARRIYAELGATRRLAEIGEPGVTAQAR